MIKSTRFAFVSAIALLAAALSCREAAAPRQITREPDPPRFVVTGSQAAISGNGYWGAATPGSGADRQDFNFNVGADLKGRVVYNEYLYNAWIKVDTTDAQTSITAFRNSSALCGTDPTTGAEVDGIGRREDGQLQNFTLVACDLGPSGSGTDFFKITFSSGGYVKQGNPPNGDIVKTVAQQAQTGNLDVTTSTSGSSLPSGYSVAVDGGASQAIGINARVTYTSLSAGSHSVVLSSVPANCTVSGGTTQSVTVTGGQTATAAYSVSCSSTTGNLDVTTSTTGSNLPSGYSLALDGGSSQPIGSNATVSFTGLAAGSHTVVLSGVPSNCTLSGSATQTVTVTSGQTATAGYSVSCAATTGNLDVTTSTSGSSLPSGYTVTVDAGSSQAIGINAKVTFTALSAGSHSVVLTGVPANCTVSGGASQSVTVASGQTATAAYSVTCVSPTGNLDVTTSTSGSSLPSGYTVAVDGGSSQSIGINAKVTFANLSAGSHSVSLSSVPANCTVSGGATKSVTVNSGQTATAAYTVTCVTPPGNIDVTTSTSGSSLPSGYTVTVDGGSNQSIGINAKITFANLSAGSHTVVLSGVPTNCTLSGSATQTVTVPSQATAIAAYSVSCITPNTSPTVNAGPDEKILLGLLYSLRWSFSDPDNGPWQYTINWGDGSSSSGTASSPGSFNNGHTYILGTFTIRVTVTDSKGASSSATKRLSVVTGLLGF